MDQYGVLHTHHRKVPSYGFHGRFLLVESCRFQPSLVPTPWVNVKSFSVKVEVQGMSARRGRPPKSAQPAKRGRGRAPKTTQPAKRGRGRPRKTPNVTTATVVPTVAPEYSPDHPFVNMLTYDRGATPEFNPTKVVPHAAKFQLPRPKPDVDDVEGTITALSRVYLSDRYVMHVYSSTLAYIKARKLHPRDVYKLVPRDIFHFFAIIYYMGFCRLPSKEDYWVVGDHLRGDHPICTSFGMSYRKFTFLWRNIYLTTPREEMTGDSDESNDEGELMMVEHNKTP